MRLRKFLNLPLELRQGFSKIPKLRLIFGAIFVSSFLEVLGLSTLYPVALILVNKNLDHLPDFILAAFEFWPIHNLQIIFSIFLCLSVAAIGVSFCALYLMEIFINKVRFESLKNLRNDLLFTYFQSDFEQASKVNSGDATNILNHEAERAVEGLFASISAIALLISLIVHIALTFILSPELTAIALLFGVGFAFYGTQLRKSIKTSSKSLVHYNNRFSDNIIQIFDDPSFIKISGFEKYFNEVTNKINEKVCGELFQISRNISLFKLTLQVVVLFSLFGILLLSTLILKLDTAVLLLFLLIFLRLAPKLISLQGQINSAVAHLPSLESIMYLEKKLIPRDNKILKRDDDHFICDGIFLDNVKFGFSDQVNLFENVSAHLESPGIFVIVGASGAGKTTFVNILSGILFPKYGKVFYQARNGTLYSQTDCRPKIGYVPQFPKIYSGTLRDNISLGRNLRDADIEWALNISELGHCLSDRGLDLDSDMRPEYDFSGGEVQRLAFARAIVDCPSILILDEPTSALDYETSKKILSTIDKLAGDRLIFVITHQDLELPSKRKKIINIKNKTITFAK